MAHQQIGFNARPSLNLPPKRCLKWNSHKLKCKKVMKAEGCADECPETVKPLLDNSWDDLSTKGITTPASFVIPLFPSDKGTNDDPVTDALHTLQSLSKQNIVILQTGSLEGDKPRAQRDESEGNLPFGDVQPVGPLLHWIWMQVVCLKIRKKAQVILTFLSYHGWTSRGSLSQKNAEESCNSFAIKNSSASFTSSTLSRMCSSLLRDVMSRIINRSEFMMKRFVFNAWRSLRKSNYSISSRATNLIDRLSNRAILHIAFLRLRIGVLKTQRSALHQQMEVLQQDLRISQRRKSNLEEWNGNIYYECRRAKSAQEETLHQLQQMNQRLHEWANNPLIADFSRPLEDQNGSIIHHGTVYFTSAENPEKSYIYSDGFYHVTFVRRNEDRLHTEEDALRVWANFVLQRGIHAASLNRQPGCKPFMLRYILPSAGVESALTLLIHQRGHSHWIFLRLITLARMAKVAVAAKRGAPRFTSPNKFKVVDSPEDLLHNLSEELANCDHLIALFSCLFPALCHELLDDVTQQVVWEKTSRDERAKLIIHLATVLGLQHGLTLSGLTTGDRSQTVPLLSKMLCYSVLSADWVYKEKQHSLSDNSPNDSTYLTPVILSKLILPNQVDSGMVELFNWMSKELMTAGFLNKPVGVAHHSPYRMQSPSDMFSLINLAGLCAALSRDRVLDPPPLPPSNAAALEIAKYCIHSAELMGAQLSVSTDDFLQPEPHLLVVFVAALYNRVHYLPPATQARPAHVGEHAHEVGVAASPSSTVLTSLPEISASVVADLMVVCIGSLPLEEELGRLKSILLSHWAVVGEAYHFYACVGLRSGLLGLVELEAMLEEAKVLHEHGLGKFTKDNLRALYYRVLDVANPPSQEEVKAHRDRFMPEKGLRRTFSTHLPPSMSFVVDADDAYSKRTETSKKALTTEQLTYIEHLDLTPAAFVHLLLYISVARYGAGPAAAGKAGYVCKPFEYFLVRHFSEAPKCQSYDFQALVTLLHKPEVGNVFSHFQRPLHRIFRRYSVGKVVVTERKMPFAGFFRFLADFHILTNPLDIPKEQTSSFLPTTMVQFAAEQARNGTLPAKNSSGFVDRLLCLNIWCCAQQLRDINAQMKCFDDKPLTQAKIKALTQQMNISFCWYHTFLDMLGMLAQISAPQPWISFTQRLTDFLASSFKSELSTATEQ